MSNPLMAVAGSKEDPGQIQEVPPEQWEELKDPGVSDKVTQLRVFLEARVKGQPKAIDAVCKLYQYELTLRRLEERRGPIAVLMCLGPSGVGKTELGRALADYFMGGEDSLVKIDCSNFSQPHTIHSLIGSPHGYIGYDDQPMFSQQNLLKKIKSQSTERSKNCIKLEKEMEMFRRQRAVIIDGVKNENFNLTELHEEFKMARQQAAALASYRDILHGANGQDGSVAEHLSNPELRQKMLEFVRSDVRELLDEDLNKPFEDAAMLLEFQARIKNIIGAYREAEIRIARFKNELKVLKDKIEETEKKIKKEISEQSKAKSSRQDTRLVILFDEIEKANPTLHQLLLQIMEEGRLTLANGQITDLRNAFIIMTSNAGSESIGDVLKQKGIGFNQSAKAQARKQYDPEVFGEVEKSILRIAERAMAKTFRPEFRSRIDDTVVFRPLSKDVFYQILDRQIEVFAISLGIMELDLVVDQEVKDLIVNQSLHRPEVGARLLNQKFRSLVKVPLSRCLASREGPRGTIRATLDSNNRVTFLLGD